MVSCARFDRRLGDAIRSRVGSIPGGRSGAAVIASTMSPAFRVVVGLLIADRRRRGTGMRALAAGVASAMAARALRDRLGRRRPGPRTEAGFPSRHAAAAAAIATAVACREVRIGRALAGAAAIGSLSRVATAEHEPGDIAAGAALGVAIARLTDAICSTSVST